MAKGLKPMTRSSRNETDIFKMTWWVWRPRKSASLVLEKNTVETDYRRLFHVGRKTLTIFTMRVFCFATGVSSSHRRKLTRAILDLGDARLFHEDVDEVEEVVGRFVCPPSHLVVDLPTRSEKFMTGALPSVNDCAWYLRVFLTIS